MKVAFVVNNMGFGGAERVISIISNELINRNYDVSICMTDGNPKVAYRLHPKIELNIVETDKFIKTLVKFGRNRSIEDYFSKISPDVVITFAMSTGSIIAPICDRKGIPYIHAERYDPYQTNAVFTNHLRWKIMVNKTRYVVFQSNGAKNYYPKRIQDNSRIIRDPLNFETMPPYYEGERKKEIVTVGRLTKAKRQDIIIKAFALLADKYPGYCLKIYGHGELEEEYKNLIENLQMQKKVLLMGSKEDVFSCINKSALFAFSSDYEGMPNALIEAMALGLPCLSTRCSPGGAEELIRDGENGRLVGCGDVEAFAEALDEMINDYSVSLQMGKRAKESVKELTVEHIVDQWEQFIIYAVDNNKDS